MKSTGLRSSLLNEDQQARNTSIRCRYDPGTITERSGHINSLESLRLRRKPLLRGDDGKPEQNSEGIGTLPDCATCDSRLAGSGFVFIR